MMEPSGSTRPVAPRPTTRDLCSPFWSLPLTYTRQSPASLPLTQPSPVTAATRIPWSPVSGRMFGSACPSCQVITWPSSVAQATAVPASLRARPDVLGYGPKVWPPASTTTPADVPRTRASPVRASASSPLVTSGIAGGAPVGRSRDVECVRVGAHHRGGRRSRRLAVGVDSRGVWVATSGGPSAFVPLVANIAVGTISATAAATPRPRGQLAAPADRGGLAADVLEGQRGAVHPIGARVHLAGEQPAQLVVASLLIGLLLLAVVQGSGGPACAHGARPGPGWSGTSRCRRRCRATSAVSASDSSS